MKKFILFVILLTAGQIILNAQVPRQILLEYATNASCPPCASSNPAAFDYLQANYDKVNSVWYHAWWPGPDDPMYVANMDENADRINYYGINGVPNYVVDGRFQGFPGYLHEYKEDLNRQVGDTTPIELSVSHTIENDSIYVDVEMYLHSAVIATQLKLRTAIIERTCYYHEQPGTNGEKFFPDVFRKFCGGSEGLDITDIAAEQLHEFSFAEQIGDDWDIDSISVVTWVQSDDSRFVFQSASDRFYFKINEDTGTEGLTEDTNREIVELNYEATKNLYLENTTNEPLNVAIVLDRMVNYDDWDIKLVYDATEIDSFDLSIPPGEREYFDLNILSGETPGLTMVNIRAVEKGENSRHNYTYKYYAIVINGDIVLFDADPAGPYSANYDRVLNNLELEYSKVPFEVYDYFDDMLAVDSNTTFIWNSGENLPVIDQAGILLAQEILDKGGKAIFANQNLVYDLMKLKRSSIARFFSRLYLDANFVEDSSLVFSIESVEGNGILDGFNFTVDPVYDTSLDVVAQFAGSSIPVLKYSGTENPAMLLHDKDGYKVAYMTFGLEQIPDEAKQEQLMGAIFNWFDSPTGVAESKNSIPVEYSLDQNYPNPFNPSTVINYQLADGAEVNLSVYNALGEKVAQLVDGYKNAGYYSVEFNAANLGSGIYFYRISTNNFFQVRKMMLLK